MKTNLLTLGLFFILNNSASAQQIATDSLDLGEDTTSHNYQAFGSVDLGTYTCGDDSTIRVGIGSGGDSITFELAVTPGSDSIKLELEVPWRGGTINPVLSIENLMSDTIPYLGQAVCTPVYMNFYGLSSMTSDGLVKITIMDTIFDFNMDVQITYVKVWSDTISTVGIMDHLKKVALSVYPNPCNGIFTVETLNQESSFYEVFDAYGRRITTGLLKEQKTNIDLTNFSKGIYFLRTKEGSKKMIKE
jgi:hypothetical protein